MVEANPNYNRFEVALAIQDAVNLRAIARELGKQPMPLATKVAEHGHRMSIPP
jgi:hypothetical protein